jgi:hypothetical protein
MYAWQIYFLAENSCTEIFHFICGHVLLVALCLPCHKKVWGNKRLDLDSKYTWVVRFTPRPPNPSKHYIEGCVDHRTGLDAAKKGHISCSCWESNPCRPTRPYTDCTMQAHLYRTIQKKLWSSIIWHHNLSDEPVIREANFHFPGKTLLRLLHIYKT